MAVSRKYFNGQIDADNVRDCVLQFLSQVLPKQSRPTIHSPACNVSNDIHDINTLEDCLTYFCSPTLLQELEDSLERVRKHKNSKAEHEEYIKEVDKKLQKLSYEYHPDKVSNRGGTFVEMATAQKLQTALNSTRTVLSILHEEFLEDLDIDHKYGFYSKLEISSLGNEEQIKKHISEVLYKTVMLSEIKQVDIIAPIRMFIRESQVSLNKYMEKNEIEFKKYRDYALCHLNRCIHGYEKLLSEFKSIDEECKSENLVHISSVMKEMAEKSSKELGILKSLERVAKCSLEGHFQIYSSFEPMDDYLILPLVYYVNVLLICTLVLEEKRSLFSFLCKWWRSGNQYVPLPEDTPVETMLNAAVVLAFSLTEEYQTGLKSVFDETRSIKEYYKQEINICLKSLKEGLETRFREEAYEEGGNKKYLLEHYAKLMNKADDINKTMLNIFRNMQECQKWAGRTKEIYENCMKDTNSFEKEIAETLEQSNVLQEKDFNVIHTNNQEYAEKDEICITGTGELEKEIAESLKQSKLLHEQVSKILQRKDEKIKAENVIDFVRSNELQKEIAESLEKNDLLQEQVSTVFKSNDQGNKVEDKNGMKFSNKYREESGECLDKD